MKMKNPMMQKMKVLSSQIKKMEMENRNLRENKKEKINKEIQIL